MPKIALEFADDASVQTFATEKKNLIGAYRTVFQLATAPSEILNSINSVMRNWGNIKSILPVNALVADVETSLKETVKVHKGKPADMANFISEVKAKAIGIFQGLEEFVGSLTLDVINSIEKTTRTKTVKVVNLTIGDTVFTPVSIFENVDFLQALPNKENLAAFYTAHNASNDFRVAVYDVLTNSARYVRERKPRATLAELEAIRASANTEGGKKLSDAQITKLDERIQKLRAKAMADATAKTEVPTE